MIIQNLMLVVDCTVCELKIRSIQMLSIADSLNGWQLCLKFGMVGAVEECAANTYTRRGVLRY